MSVDWYVYIVKCSDGTFYTGVTTDLSRRVSEHNGTVKGDKGAKYTKPRRPVALVYSEQLPNRSTAQQREATLRSISRLQKEMLAKNGRM